MAINRYDYISDATQLASLITGTTTELKKQKKQLDQEKYLTSQKLGVELQKAQKVQDTAMETAKLNAYVSKDIARLRADTDVILKVMQTDNDKIIAAMNNLSAEERVKLQIEMQKLVQLLKNENVLQAIDKEYEFDVKKLNLESDEAMKRAVIGSLFQIITNGKGSPLRDLVKTGEFVVLVQLFKKLYPDIETWNDPNFINALGGKNENDEEQLNEEESKTYEERVQRKGQGGEGKYRARRKR